MTLCFSVLFGPFVLYHTTLYIFSLRKGYLSILAASSGVVDLGSGSINSSTSVLAANHSSFRSRLGQQLDEIKSPAPFTSFCELDAITDPQIYVGDHGPIGLPLSNHDAQVIIRASHQAPFGRGSETIVESSVRNTWELNSEQFELRNSEWKNFMGHILAKISKELGVDAELYKMLLYDKGAMFKAHQDSEKAPGMFGTLVVCLPSPHSGGDVRVKHAGIRRCFQPRKRSNHFCGGTPTLPTRSVLMNILDPCTLRMPIQ